MFAVTYWTMKTSNLIELIGEMNLIDMKKNVMLMSDSLDELIQHSLKNVLIYS